MKTIPLGLSPKEAAERLKEISKTKKGQTYNQSGIWINKSDFESITKNYKQKITAK